MNEGPWDRFSSFPISELQKKADEYFSSMDSERFCLALGDRARASEYQYKSPPTIRQDKPW